MSPNHGPMVYEGRTCQCCGQMLSPSRRLQDYCDPICYAAHTTLSGHALEFWRRHCERFDAPKGMA